MNPNDQDNTPLIRIGQGEYARDVMPDDVDDLCDCWPLAVAIFVITVLLIGGILW